MNISINKKKIVLNFFISLILSLIITFLNEELPNKKFSEYKVYANLNENIRLLNLFLPPDKRHSLNTILLTKKKNITYKFQSNIKTVKNCSIPIVGNDRIMFGEVNPYSVYLEFIVDENFNKDSCNKTISLQLNEMFNQFFQSLLKDQIQSYNIYLKAIEESEKNVSKVIENLMKEYNKENNKNININLLQSNFIDSRNLILDKKVIDTMERILKIENVFYVDGQKTSVQKTNPYSIFIFCLIIIFLILNHSILLKFLKKFLK